MEFDHFSVGFLTTRADAPQRSDAEDARIQDAHMAHLADLHAQGILAAAGPLADEHFRGLLLFNTDVDTAQQLMSTDPAVEASWFDVTIIPWMVPSGAVHCALTSFPRSMSEVN
jgi:uncharacterized protein YciI